MSFKDLPIMPDKKKGVLLLPLCFKKVSNKYKTQTCWQVAWSGPNGRQI